ncbi:MAG: nucleotide exchange factor GrpE [Chthoniobacterales bacterium]|nr:nucleotide exchange factor GrpE [Chthoniobacterales bacterium]
MSNSRRTAKIHYPSAQPQTNRKDSHTPSKTSSDSFSTSQASTQQSENFPAQTTHSQILENQKHSTSLQSQTLQSDHSHTDIPQESSNSQPLDPKLKNVDPNSSKSTHVIQEEQKEKSELAPPSPSTESSSTQQTPQQTDSQLETLKAELRKYYEIALRTQADFDNYRKRIAREREESIRYANAALLERLLPILDSFELGLQTARKTPEAEPIAKGFELVERQLQDFLRECGVEPVDAVGKPFDPNLHEAVSQQHHDQIPPGHVIHQIRRGFKLHDRLLRPATVIVSCGKPLEGVTA